MAAQWRVEDAETQVSLTGLTAQQGLVSLHFLRGMLGRRRRLWLTTTLLGAVLGLAYFFVVPPPAVGTVTLYLAHPANSNPVTAMQTDVSMLRTRTMAQQMIDDLGLATTPDKLQAKIGATTVTPSVLTLTIEAPDAAQALKRAQALAQTYLAFRTDQLGAQTQAVIAGQQSRLASLQTQLDQVNQQYEAAFAAGGLSSNQTATLLAQRAQINSEISTLQNVIQQAQLDLDSVLRASHVLDPAAVIPQSHLKAPVLTVGSGAIGGLFVGVVYIVVTGLTSQKLRRRDEVALALSAPVLFSIPPARRWRPRRHEVSKRQLGRVVPAMAEELFAGDSERHRVGFVAIGLRRGSAQLVAALAEEIANRGFRTGLVDLTGPGHADLGLGSAISAELRDRIFVVGDEPSTPPGDEPSTPPGDAGDEAEGTSDALLALTGADLGLGFAHLSRWVECAVVLVEAGDATPEMLRTASRQLRSADIPVPFAVLLGADESDYSDGGLGTEPSARSVP